MGLDAIMKGTSKKICISKLRRRFSPVGARNFFFVRPASGTKRLDREKSLARLRDSKARD